MKVCVFEIEDWERQPFEKLSGEHDIRLVSEPLSKHNAGQYADADVISTFIYSTLDEEVLQSFTNLRLIATRSTGFDHIDLDTCKRQGVAVAFVPSYGMNTVAEHVFALLLAISHRLEEAIDRTRKGDFSPRGLQGFDLRGKLFGVIGTGDIGMAAIRIARGFEMDVIAYDIAPDENASHELGFRYVDMETLLRTSDVITLHVPATPKTRHLISWDQLAKMKDGVVLINTARGEVVELRALVRALAEGKVAAAGLDVLPAEPVIREEAELLRSVYEHSHNLETLLADEVVVRMRNVVVTPHSAFNTREAVQRLLDTTIDNIRAFAEGHPQNTVTME